MDSARIFEAIFDEWADGERIDAALSACQEEISRSYIQKLIEAGNLELNGEICRSKKARISRGDRVRLIVPAPVGIEVLPEDVPINIIYEDDELLIVNKDKGMVVHPAPGNESGTLVNAVLSHCEGRLSSINGKIRPGIVHRLDKDTSGLIIIAKTDAAHRLLAGQLEARSVTRAYSAIVHNNFTDDEGAVDAPIGRDPRNRLRQSVNGEGSRHAVTYYSVLERFGRFTHIEARLETGRTHQIRVHMAYIKHPVLGDMLYGPGGKTLGAESQALHAGRLGFIHPKTGGYMEFESGPPEDFMRLLVKLRDKN